MTELKKCYERKMLSPEFPYMPKAEWEGRIKKAKKIMADKGVDALFLLNRKNWTYYFGWVKPYPYVYPAAGIVPKDGPATFITEVLGINSLELKGYAERAIGFRGDTKAPTPVSPDPVVAMADLIKDLDLENGTIGVELGPFGWWTGFTQAEWENLKKQLPKVKWVDAQETVVWPQRMIKTQWEQDTMRRMYQVACRGYLKAIEFARPGVNEKDVFKAMMEVWLNEGIIDSIYSMSVLQTSRNIATSFYEDHILKQGDYIFLDGGPSYKEYEVDCQRQIWIGDPGDEARKWAYSAEIAHIEVEDLIKPGTKMGALWQKGHEVIARYLGKSIWQDIRSPQWIGWVGHSVGLGLHEPPYIVEGAPEELQPGMVINLEFPAFSVKKRVFYNMPENTYIITKNGFENLTLDLGPYGIYIKT